MVLVAALCDGCTEPQTGVLTKSWCQPQSPSTVMLDDLEDGDAASCDKTVAHWVVHGIGALIPGPGEEAKPVELPPDDPAWSRVSPSFRAQHLHGSLGPGDWGRLVLPLANLDLTPFLELDFWAHSDSPVLNIRVGVATATTSEYDAFAGDVMITQAWGAGGSINNIPLVGGALARSDGTPATDADLALATAITFEAPAGGGDFGFWIDDVQLKRRPVQ